jgi:hypothetical protein
MTPTGEQKQTQQQQTQQPDFAALRTELDALKTQLNEQGNATKFWYDKAQAKEKPAAADKGDETDDADVLEAITTKGVKGLDEILAKRGYARQADVDAKVEARAGQLAAEQTLYAEYPELKDQKSDFFKEVAAEYGALIKDGVPQARAMQMAAKTVELSMIREGKRETPKQKTEREKGERETERRARIAAQTGDRGGRVAAGAAEEDDELTDEQKHIAAQFGITEEAYQKRAKEGVNRSMGKGR